MPRRPPDSSSKPRGTPLYGQPSWWGDADEANNSSPLGSPQSGQGSPRLTTSPTLESKHKENNNVSTVSSDGMSRLPTDVPGL